MRYQQDNKEEKEASIDELSEDVIERTEIEQPNYDYGSSQQPLNGQYQVRNIGSSSGGSSIYIGNDSLTTTGTKSIIGVGFQPKYVEITAQIGGSGEQSNSFGYSDGTTTYTIWNYSDDVYNGGNSYSTSNIIELYGNSSNYDIRASLSSLDSDGFTLSVTDADTTGNFIYKCYG